MLAHKLSYTKFKAFQENKFFEVKITNTYRIKILWILTSKVTIIQTAIKKIVIEVY